MDLETFKKSELDIVEVYLYYDGPIVFLTREPNTGQLFFTSWGLDNYATHRLTYLPCNENPNPPLDEFLPGAWYEYEYIPVTEDRRQQFLRGELTFYSMYTEPTNGEYFAERTYLDRHFLEEGDPLFDQKVETFLRKATDKSKEDFTGDKTAKLDAGPNYNEEEWAIFSCCGCEVKGEPC